MAKHKAGVARKTAAPGPVFKPPPQPPKDQSRQEPKNKDDASTTSRSAHAQSTASFKDRRKSATSCYDFEFASGTVTPAASTKTGSASNSASTPRDDRPHPSTKTLLSSSNPTRRASYSPDSFIFSIKSRKSNVTNSPLPQLTPLPRKRTSLGPPVPQSSVRRMGNQQSLPSDLTSLRTVEVGTIPKKRAGASTKSKNDRHKRPKSSSTKLDKKARKERKEREKRRLASSPLVILDDEEEELGDLPPRKKSKPNKHEEDDTHEIRENRPSMSSQANTPQQRSNASIPGPHLLISTSESSQPQEPQAPQGPQAPQALQVPKVLQVQPQAITPTRDPDSPIGIHNVPANARIFADYVRRNSGAAPLPVGLSSSPTIPHSIHPPSISTRPNTNESVVNADRAELAISRIRNSRQQLIVLDEDDEPLPILQRNEEADQAKKKLATKMLERELFGTSSNSGSGSSTPDRRNSTEKSTAKTADVVSLNREPRVRDVSVIVVNGSRNNSSTPRRPTRTSTNHSDISIRDSQEPDSCREPTPKRDDKGKGKDISNSPTKEMPKGTSRRKPPVGQNRIDPSQMQRLLGKKKLEGSDTGFSWSVESTPAPRSPPRRTAKETRQSPTELPASLQKASLTQVNQEREDVFAAHGYNGPRPSSLLSPGPGAGDVGMDMEDIPSPGPSTAKNVRQTAICINLDSDDEEIVPQTPAAHSAHFKNSPNRPESVPTSQAPAMDHHMDVDPVEDGYSNESGFSRVASRPRMADYRSFKPPITRSNMLQRYAHMGKMDPDPYHEVMIDWTRSSEVIDKLLNDDRMVFNPEYQMNWDNTVLPELERKSEFVDRNYFGNEYLERVFSFNIPKEDMDKEIERLELTCFSLFQEAAAYIVQRNYSGKGFPYKSPVRGILDTYFLYGKQVMTPLQRLLFLFDKICFVDGETSGSVKIRFADWYEHRTPAKFYDYKGVLSDSAICDLVDIHTEIMRRWESGDYELAPPSPSLQPQPNLVDSSNTAESQRPAASEIPFMQPAAVTTSKTTGNSSVSLTPTDPSSKPTTDAKMRVARKRRYEDMEDEHRKAATASTFKIALDESLALETSPRKTSARSALKRPHNLFEDFTREAAHIAQTKSRPRFVPENIIKAQQNQISKINDRLLYLDRQKTDTLNQLMDFTNTQNEKLDEAVAIVNQLLNLTHNNHASLGLLLSSTSTTQEVLEQRRQTTAVEKATWTEFPNFVQRRHDLMTGLMETQNRLSNDLKKINDEAKALVAQLERIQGPGKAITLPDQFLEFSRRMKAWPNGKETVGMDDVEDDKEEDIEIIGHVRKVDVQMEGKEGEEVVQSPRKKRRAGPEVERKATRAEVRRNGRKVEEVLKMVVESSDDDMKVVEKRDDKRLRNCSEDGN